MSTNSPSRMECINQPKTKVKWKFNLGSSSYSNNVTSSLVFVSWMLMMMLLCCLDSTTAFDPADCRKSLGMENLKIPDTAITASSSYEDKSVGPKSARIRTEMNGGAWCPKPPITKDAYEYLQIDLGELTVITLVEVQGRFGNGQGREYAAFFLLEYQREDDGEWIRFRKRNGDEKFKGNSNTYLAEVRDVDPPIIGKRIRFIPYADHARTVCMRVELYGCKWLDGVVSYSMPEGHQRGVDVELDDFTYDGIRKDKYLSKGMGQLMDGIEGQDHFRFDRGTKIKGYDWVGWKNDTPPLNNRDLEIIFKFDQVRNFSSISLHCNNYFSKDIRVFKEAQVYFSVGGRYYLSKPVEYPFLQDKWMEHARYVKIPLNNNVGRYVRVVLVFDAKWIMISEVTFESVPAVGNFTIETAPPTTVKSTTEGNSDRGFFDNSGGEDGDGIVVNVGQATEGSDEHFDTPKEVPTVEDDYIGIIVGAIAAFIVIIVIIVLIIIIRHKRSKLTNNRRCLKPPVVSDRHVTINLNDLRGSANGKVANGNMYNSVATEDIDSDREICNGGDKLCKGPQYLEPLDSLQGRELPDLPITAELADSSPRDYAVPDVTKSALIVALPPQPPTRVTPTSKQSTPGVMMNSLDKPPTYDALYAAADVINVQVPNIPSFQGVSGNNVYAVPNAEILLTLEHSVIQFPRENLKFIEVLGEGQFGEVHLCECVRVGEYMKEDTYNSRTANRPVLVAVKMLRRNADDRARSDFHKEIKIMSQLNDPNIVKVLGVCTQEEPLCMIVEYMKYGDLNQFLLDHVPESPVAQATNAKMLSYGALICMASQIASGMKYLESLNMVHRDLATRNCLVGTNYTIKISDFGMSRSLYSADYYRIEGRAVLPIRWMAWESILLGKFTTKSDVWSFAVTLWEVLTFAKDQPYDTLTDEQVIENAGHYYRNNNKQMYLSQPPNCPKEIYDLMVECWNRQESDRPTFREIHMFLQRKNMGYNPKDDRMNQIKVPIC